MKVPSPLDVVALSKKGVDVVFVHADTPALEGCPVLLALQVSDLLQRAAPRRHRVQWQVLKAEKLEMIGVIMTTTLPDTANADLLSRAYAMGLNGHYIMAPSQPPTEAAKAMIVRRVYEITCRVNKVCCVWLVVALGTQGGGGRAGSGGGARGARF